MEVVYVSEDGQEHWIDAKIRPTLTLDQAIAQSRPGQMIRMIAGDYCFAEPLHFPRSGTADQPIIVRGEPDAIIDAAKLPDPSVSASNPGRDGYAVFQLIDVAHIRLELFTIKRAWPSAVYIENSHHLAFSDLDITEGTYAFYANGEQTRGISITGCRWVQNPDIWRQIRWDEIHDGKDEDGNVIEVEYRYLNGAFFGADDIIGDVEIIRNDICDCYNGVRMDVSQHNLDAPVGSFNRDVRIFDNRFRYIRDNPIEPEATAVGWWIGRNRFYNCHKLFSQDGVRGGFWYYFGNICWFDSRPGPEGDENNGGAVFKLGKGGSVAQPDYISVCLHNSFFLRQKYIKKGTTRGLINARNAIEHADPAKLPDDLMPFDQTFFGPADKLSLSADGPLPVSFEGDLANHPTYPAVFAPYDGVLRDPRVSDDPLFEDGLSGRFDLRAQHREGYCDTLSIPMPDGGTWLSHRAFWPGALTDGEIFEGPDYVPVDLDYVRSLPVYSD
ncbi:MULTISPECIES: hypothetical protein [unclassified Thalassospira]|uniref:hypothetical protein n=1 Tax=unclassified Thalassospira TaxID=2648997 RepID=UPI0007A59483|nr:MULTISPECIES: hypothetical protein [unclassified Thalassospira]KZC97957.1 hypothetical protein AUQ41_16970 [Thalassospira sp. MCCC 1A02898]ONH87870.1 hypothetical protein TH47_09495 [Thalassospira sp. MCCC 1A02803]